MEELKKKIELIKEKLTDPFNPDGVDRDLMELFEMLKKAKREEIEKIRKDFEDIVYLVNHNIGVIEGSFQIFLKHFKGGFISRRV